MDAIIQHIVLLFGAMPWDVKMRQAFEKSTSCAHTIADASFFFSGSECFHTGSAHRFGP